MSAAHLRAPTVKAVKPARSQGVFAACVGKERFKSAKLAHQVARRSVMVRSVYRCIICGGWHLGASEPDVNAQWRRKANLVRKDG